MVHPTYAFEELGDDLPRAPLAAHRALGIAGIRMSQSVWSQLPLESRLAIAQAGVAPVVDAEAVRAHLRGKQFARVQLGHPIQDPDPHAPPRDLAAVLGPWLPTVNAAWASLLPVDRFVLVVLTANPRLLWRALGEIGARSGWRAAGLPEIQGLLARSEIRVGRAARERLYDPRFQGGRAGVLARASGVRAARRLSDLLDLHSEAAVGPVELEWCAPRFDAVVWQAHVSTADGQFSVAGSLLAASTAAVALLDMIVDVEPTAFIVGTTLANEPWLAGGSEEESTIAM